MGELKNCWCGHIRAVATMSMVVMAVLWGSTFFVLKDLVGRISPADLLAVRFTIASLVLVLVGARYLKMSWRTWRTGIVMGLWYGAAQLLQTFGLEWTSASVSGFLTGLYVVLTPILQALFMRGKVAGRIWLAVGLATLGLGALTINFSAGGLAFGFGELLTLGCALSYAAHIVYTGKHSTPETAISLSIAQCLTITVLTWIFALPDGVQLPNRAIDWAAIAYLAVFCGALAIFLQVWAQAHVEPTQAAIVMSSEPIWAAAFAVFAGQEPLLVKTIIGGASMFAAMVLASLPDKDENDQPVKVESENPVSVLAGDDRPPTS